MSLEGKKETSPIKAGLLTAGLAVGTMVYGGIEGKKIGAEEVLDQMNAHWLTPKAVVVLKESTGATDRDVAELGVNLKRLLHDELERIKDRNRLK